MCMYSTVQYSIVYYVMIYYNILCLYLASRVALDRFFPTFKRHEEYC